MMYSMARTVSILISTVLIVVLLGACGEKRDSADSVPANELAVSESTFEEDTKNLVEAKTILAMYEGILPAADAEGIHHILSLFDDDTFHLILTYIGKPEGENTFEEEGEYITVTGFENDPDAILYVLQPEDEINRVTFLELSSDAILMLDREQQRIDSALNYQLERVFP